MASNTYTYRGGEKLPLTKSANEFVVRATPERPMLASFSPGVHSSMVTPVVRLASSGVLQSKCACGGAATTNGECAECRKKSELLRRQSSTDSSSDWHYGEAPPIVHDVLRSPGQPLQSEVRAFFEPRFGHDFSQVRMHTDVKAAESARAVGALAYTAGRDVVFGSNQFAPESSAGRQLLAHELTHVVQQRGIASAMQPRLSVGEIDDPAEREADRASAYVMRGEPVPSIDRHAPLLSRRVIHTGRILNEGSCQHLACNSRWACLDDTNGVVCPDGTRNATSITGHSYRPLFTCDTNCENNQTCGANEHYMAIPHSRFKRSKCAQDLVICSSGSFTHASVRDRSNVEAWEVGPSVLSALGTTGGDITNGAIYPDESDPGFAADTRCRRATPDADTEAPAPGAGTPGAESHVPDSGREEK